MAEPLAFGLFRAASSSAWHLELRDSYTPSDPDLARLAGWEPLPSGRALVGVVGPGARHG